MIRVVGKGAHIGRADVQSMALVFGCVGEPAADLRPRFNQSQTNVIAAGLEEVRSD